MTATSRPRVDSDLPTARATIPFPVPADVDLAPQLLVIALAQAALAATHRALDTAHPRLANAQRRGCSPSFTDAEHYATLALLIGGDLAQILADYTAAVRLENLEPDDDLF